MPPPNVDFRYAHDLHHTGNVAVDLAEIEAAIPREAVVGPIYRAGLGDDQPVKRLDFRNDEAPERHRLGASF